MEMANGCGAVCRMNSPSSCTASEPERRIVRSTARSFAAVHLFSAHLINWPLSRAFLTLSIHMSVQRSLGLGT